MNKGKKFNSIGRKPRILVAPLDWGLGHTTRCIPIINELICQNCEVYIAAEGAAALLLQDQFLTPTFLPLKGYRVRYSKKTFFHLGLLFQVPKVIIAMYHEHRWLSKIIREHDIDGVISDNRPGLYNQKIVSVYITHQLKVETGGRFTGKIAARIHNFFIRKFHLCWVPDDRGTGLAGKLSHPPTSANIRYIGPLSRFKKLRGIKKEIECLILLTGPEPQRSIFEKIIFRELRNIEINVLVVRGLPGESKMPAFPGGFVRIVNHLSAADLNYAMQQSEIIVSRSGYTTVMDIVKIEQKSILVPTPGQTEQEYLARHLYEMGICFSINQENFSLEKAIRDSKGFGFNFPAVDMEQYKSAVTEFIHSLDSNNFTRHT
ncbi:MAG: glycosyltransferase [Ginsengibacter sp.]